MLEKHSNLQTTERRFLKKRKVYNNGLWTEGRFNSFITSALRSASRRWPPKYTVLNEAKTEKKTNSKTGRIAQHFVCASCLVDYPAKEVQVDHITPIGYDKSWDEFINGLFCERENLQVLCKVCHAVKTKQERKTLKQ